MAVTYTWDINNLVCLPENQCVVTIFYTVSGTDGAYAATRNNAIGVANQPDEDYIPYPQLTKEIVLGWVKSNLTEDGVLAVESEIEQEINSHTNPPIVTPPLPW